MRCITCKNKIQPGQTACSFCGAMAESSGTLRGSPSRAGSGSPSSVSRREALSRARALMEELKQSGTFASESPAQRADRGRTLSPGREEAEEFGGMNFPEMEPGMEEESADEQPRQPPPPAWTRWIFPLFLIIYFAFQYFSRDLQQFIWIGSHPALQSMVLCEEIVDGEPVNPATVFPVSENDRLTVMARWTGSPRGSDFTLRWTAPGGDQRESKAVLLPQPDDPQPDDEEFITYGITRLRSSTPRGEWLVEILLDGEVAGEQAFQIQD